MSWPSSLPAAAVDGPLRAPARGRMAFSGVRRLWLMRDRKVALGAIRPLRFSPRLCEIRGAAGYAVVLAGSLTVTSSTSPVMGGGAARKRPSAQATNGSFVTTRATVK